MRGTALESAARTADATSEPIGGGGRLILHVNATVDDGTAAVTPKIQTPDPVSGNWITIWTAAATIADVVHRIYQLGPGLLASTGGGYTDTENIIIPEVFRVFMDAADAESLTYSVGYETLPY